MLTKPTPRFVAIQSSYWACYCCIISFSSVYLLGPGLFQRPGRLVISLGGRSRPCSSPAFRRRRTGCGS